MPRKMPPLLTGSLYFNQPPRPHFCQGEFLKTCFVPAVSEHSPKVPLGLISTDAGGTSIHRWVSQKAAAKCSQITPTSTQSEGPDIGTLFNPMVLPLAKMAVSGFTWCEYTHNPHHDLISRDTPERFLRVQIRARRMSAQHTSRSRWQGRVVASTTHVR